MYVSVSLPFSFLCMPPSSPASFSLSQNDLEQDHGSSHVIPLQYSIKEGESSPSAPLGKSQKKLLLIQF